MGFTVAMTRRALPLSKPRISETVNGFISASSAVAVATTAAVMKCVGKPSTALYFRPLNALKMVLSSNVAFDVNDTRRTRYVTCIPDGIPPHSFT